MYKVFFALLMISIGFSAFSQDRKVKRYETTSKNNIIKINPLSLLLTNVSISFERIISEKFGLQMQAGYWIGGSVQGTKWSGFSFTPEGRYYVTNEGRPKGFYVAAFGRYQEIKTEVEKSNTTLALSRIGGGVAVGYQFLFRERITWDIFLGPQYLVNSGSKDEVSTAEYGQFIGNLGLRLGTTVGVAF